jgi:hypothetical protein
MVNIKHLSEQCQELFLTAADAASDDATRNIDTGLFSMVMSNPK